MESINKKIVSVEVKTGSAPAPVVVAPAPQPLVRPEALQGTTYKIKSVGAEHAIYLTINHIEVNGRLKPFEVFINSRDAKAFKWVMALTVLMSAVFRMSDDVTWMIQEMKSIFDPEGGYWRTGGKKERVESVLGEIAFTLEQHLQQIGTLATAKEETVIGVAMPKPSGAPCPKCQMPSLVKSEGCESCLSCGYSKCS